MIAHIVEGGNTVGLMVYLAGPGRANEHEAQHLVAGDDIIMDRFGDWDELSASQAVDIAHMIDRHMDNYGVCPIGSVRTFNHDTQQMELVKRAPNHVWHCSLSLSPEEGPLTDEQWRAIATDFMEQMGFTGADGKAPCRWVAVRHGLAKNGGDHIHIAANIVRSDGTKWSNFRDQKRAQRACNLIEHKYGLMVIESREHERGARADSPSDLNASARRDPGHVSRMHELTGRWEVVTDRAKLEARVRACAVAASDEADFIDRLRDCGVRVRPRFATGRTDVVVGYSVALHSRDGERSRWYGGGRLARDLTLSRLRMRWVDTPESAQRAVMNWRTAWAGRVIDHSSEPSWAAHTKALSVWHEQMKSINPHDPHALAAATQNVSALLASAGLHSSDWRERATLMRASRCVGRHGQTHHAPPRAMANPAPVLAAAQALSMARGKQSVAAAALTAEIVMMTRSLSSLYMQAQQTQTAQAILADTTEAWNRIHRPNPWLGLSAGAPRAEEHGHGTSVATRTTVEQQTPAHHAPQVAAPVARGGGISELDALSDGVVGVGVGVPKMRESGEERSERTRRLMGAAMAPGGIKKHKQVKEPVKPRPQRSSDSQRRGPRL